MNSVRVSVPGRICLFGEHQDYLKLPVITAAINLRVAVSGQSQPEREIYLKLPDIDANEAIALPPEGQLLSYRKERDYFRSVVNVLLRHGLHLDHGFECKVSGNIPINSGTSSSSALNVAWARFLIEYSAPLKQNYQDPAKVAYLAYLAEVEEFGEPGGQMDHYATALGGVLYLDFTAGVHYEKLNTQLGTFVLGDSLEPKNTKDILFRVKDSVLQTVQKIKKVAPSFNLNDFSVQEVDQFSDLITREQKEILHGALLNRDITREAKKLFQATSFDHLGFGRLLTEHQEILNNNLHISTTKIEKMLIAASQAGALGGKLNGSGGGGCMFAYAPEDPHKVARAIEDAGGKTDIISVDCGIKVEYR